MKLFLLSLFVVAAIFAVPEPAEAGCLSKLRVRSVSKSRVDGSRLFRRQCTRRGGCS